MYVFMENKMIQCFTNSYLGKPTFEIPFLFSFTLAWLLCCFAQWPPIFYLTTLVFTQKEETWSKGNKPNQADSGRQWEKSDSCQTGKSKSSITAFEGTEWEVTERKGLEKSLHITSSKERSRCSIILNSLIHIQPLNKSLLFPQWTKEKSQKTCITFSMPMPFPFSIRLSCIRYTFWFEHV